MRKLPLSYLATITGSLAIAVGLVVVSYGHIRKFAIEAGAAEWEAAVIAVTVDALVVLSIAAIGHARSVGQHPPAMAKVALIVGIVATTGANIHHGLDHGWAGIVVSLWVPIAAELAYQLAMSAVRVGPTGGQKRPVICGHVVPVATVMERVHAKPAICGGHVPVAMLAVTLVAVRRPAPRDPRPVICTRVATVAGLMATMPPRPRPAMAICGGHLIPVATVVRPLADLRPVICGHLVAVTEVAMPRPVKDLRPVICGGHVATEDVAMPKPLADLRPVICTALVTVAEVMARTAVAIPAPVATKEKPAKRRVATATSAAAREEVILEWLTDPDAPDDRAATATSEEVAALLAEAGHGHVSARTVRRDLQHVRSQLATATT